MQIRTQIEKKIAAKILEISEIEGQMREAKAYIAGMQEALKFIPRDNSEVVLEKSPELSLRYGSDMAKAYTFLKSIARPVYIDEILKGIGKEVNKENRSTVSGSLGNYARRNEIFTRTAPNTFGLVEFSASEIISGMRELSDDNLPPSFGIFTDASNIDNGPSDEDIPF